MHCVIPLAALVPGIRGHHSNGRAPTLYPPHFAISDHLSIKNARDLEIYVYICIYKRIKSKYEYSRKLYIQKYLYIFPFFFPLIPKYIPYTLYTFSCEEKLVSSFLNKFCVTVLKISNVCSATSKKEKNVQAQGWPSAIIL